MLSFAGAIVMPNLVHGALNAPFAASSASTGQALQPWLCNAQVAFFATDVEAEFALILPPLSLSSGEMGLSSRLLP
jgi:hypothetical protein